MSSIPGSRSVNSLPARNSPTSQSTYHPGWGRALPLGEEISTLLTSQAATRRGSYWLLKLKGLLQDSTVETSATVDGTSSRASAVTQVRRTRAWALVTFVNVSN